MNIEIREFQPEDFANVMTLVQTCYGDAAPPPERWRWRHFEFDPKDSTMFVATHDNKIVGLRPMALFDYFLHGQPLKGALFSAVMVHPSYRRLGIFSRLVKACMEEAWRRGAAFINTMPNDISYRGFIKLGWQDPGDRTLYIRPINLKTLARQKIRPSWLGFSLGFITQGLVRLISPRPKQDRLTIVAVPAFDPEAGDLSRRIGVSYDGLILHRTHAWLTWRYKSNPWNKVERFEALSADGRVNGYAVTNMSIQWDIIVGYIVEILGETAEVRQALIEASIEHLRDQGAQICAAVMSPPELMADFRTQGFFRVPQRISPKKFHTVYQPHPDHTATFDAVRTINRWYQTLGDWDVI
jgi:GNAT superfamily N-acetyltransferase